MRDSRDPQRADSSRHPAYKTRTTTATFRRCLPYATRLRGNYAGRNSHDVCMSHQDSHDYKKMAPILAADTFPGFLLEAGGRERQWLKAPSIKNIDVYGSRHPLPKAEKSAHLIHFLGGWGLFICYLNFPLRPLPFPLLPLP